MDVGIASPSPKLSCTKNIYIFMEIPNIVEDIMQEQLWSWAYN
jgi:hypothetical protein